MPSSKWSDSGEEEEDCREWLERMDAVKYKRDFRVEPVLVSNADQVGISSSLLNLFIVHGNYPLTLDV